MSRTPKSDAGETPKRELTPEEKKAARTTAAKKAWSTMRQRYSFEKKETK